MNEPVEKEINGHIYSFRKLDTFTQFHVVRKLSPAFMLFADLADKNANFNELDIEAIMPIMEFISTMKEEDVNYLLKVCLNVVARKNPQSGDLQKILAGGNLQLMFQDIDLSTMIQLTVQVIMGSVGNFYNSPLGSTSQAG